MATRETISIGDLANDRKGDKLREGATKINRNFGKIWYALGGDSDTFSSTVNFYNNGISFDGATTDSLKTTLNVDDPTQNNTILLPNSSGRILLDSDSDTVSNKTLISSYFVNPSFKDSEDAVYSFNTIIPSRSSDVNIRFPSLSDSDTFVFLAATQTLTNKTFTTPTLNSPTITGTINDTNGNEIETITATASAVNYFTKANAALGNAPSIGVDGNDSDIAMHVKGKNGGPVLLYKFARRMATVTGSGKVPNKYSNIKFNSGTALAMTLDDGLYDGEEKIFTNAGSGTATVTPTNFANGTSFSLVQYSGCSITWDGSNWYLFGKSDSNDITIV